MPEILILADDLSGAADCAGGCAAAGLETLVLLRPDVRTQRSVAVLAVDLATRERPAWEASHTLARVIERLWDASVKVIYHKIDSTLRGAWAHEVAAACESLRAARGSSPLAVVAPTFPARGRITRGARVLVQAPGAPARDAGEIAPPLRQCGLNVRSLDRGEVNAAGLAGTFAALAHARIDAVVCDAETDQDLANIAAAGLSSGIPLFWVGSAGLMRPIAAAFSAGDTVPGILTPGPGPLLFVVGSAAPVARAQFEALAAQPELAVLRFHPTDIMSRAGQLADALEAALGRGADTAVAIEPASPGQMPLDPAVVASLADVVGPHLRAFGGLVVTGGETARRLLDSAQISAIKLSGEVEVGIPWGRALEARAPEGLLLEPNASGAIGLEPGFPIITKAGAFGDPGTLVRCREAVRWSVAAKRHAGVAAKRHAGVAAKP